MLSPTLLTQLLARNAYVIRRMMDGLSHADSLLIPSFGGNCANWIIGHVLVSRSRALDLLGQPPLWKEATAARYVTGTDPITDPDDPAILTLDALLDVLAASEEQLNAALSDKTAEDMAQPTPDDDAPLGQVVLGLIWHETYHAGQLEYLRRLAGKEEKVFG